MNFILKKSLLWVSVILFMIMNGCTTTNQPPTVQLSTHTPVPTVIPVFPSLSPPPTVDQATPTSTAATNSNSVSATDKASFISENYPDNSMLKPDEKFVKTWKIKNTGTATWTTAYTMVLTAAPQGDTLGGPPQTHFPQETLPGQTLDLSLSLAAPSTPGTYTVYWTLKDEHGDTIPVDGSNLWVKVLVCDSTQPCSPFIAGGSVSASGISATLTDFSSGDQSANAKFCMTLPSRNYGPGGGTVSLIVDQKAILASSGGSLDSGCFEFDFPIGSAELGQAQHVAISISNVRLLGGTSNADCETARNTLKQKYPGLDFQCDIGSGTYYTHLQLPSGMTVAQAQQIIIDAVERAVYGPWVLTIR